MKNNEGGREDKTQNEFWNLSEKKNRGKEEGERTKGSGLP